MESNYNIRQDKNFKRELKNIYEYIAYELKEKGIAIKFLNLVIEKLKLLEYFPRAYKILMQEKEFEYRKFIVKNYIIIYKINLKEKQIDILHIYNQKKNYHRKF